MLQASHLHYAYPEAGREHTVLRDVSLSLQAGEHVALVGSSGSGKSTLLNLLGGIDTPASGEIQLAGKLLSRLREPELTLFRRQHIGFIYQQFNLIPTLTVAENILLPLMLLGVDSGGTAPPFATLVGSGAIADTRRGVSRSIVRRGTAARGDCACLDSSTGVGVGG